MTEKEFNEIKSLIIGLGGITEFKSTADRVDKALSILDRNKQLLLCGVSNRRELLIAYEKNHYTPQEWALASEQCIDSIDNFLAINCC